MPLNPAFAEAFTATDHVLIKGFHDSGTIVAVYGPYSKSRAEWLAREFGDCSTYNWTVAKLSDFREPMPEPVP